MSQYPLKPRKYQEVGTQFLAEHKRAMLLDDPGLGKTLQAANAAVPPILVACPTYLVEQWANFIQGQYPGQTAVYTLGGSQYKRLKDLNSIKEPMWTVVNIEMLRTYNFPPVQTLIIDESHHCRNAEAAQTKAAFEIARTTPRVYELTASPIYKEVDDLWMQLRIIDPNVFRSYTDFCRMYANVKVTPWRTSVIGARDPRGLRKMLSRYAIGRSYSDVGLELPEEINEVINLQMPPHLTKVYKQLQDEYRLANITFANAASMLHVLRRLTVCKDKLDTAKALLEDNIGSRAVLYCWYKETAHALAKAIGAPCIDGDMSVSERVRVARSGHKHIVATMASMSEGVDLSAYKMVVFFECDYTPGMMYQAKSRVKRHSANNSPVRTYTIMMKRTIDEVVYRKVDQRGISEKEILEEAINWSLGDRGD